MSPPRSPADTILTVNAGSSSIKYAVFDGAEPEPRRIDAGRVDRIGPLEGEPSVKRTAADYVRAGEEILRKIEASPGVGRLAGIGHRVVHSGLEPRDHQRVTPALLEALRAAVPLDLAHLPAELALIEAFGDRLRGVPQVACFDTAFFRDLPCRARLLPIPRRYHERGVRRLGFHGLSYRFLVDELARLDGAARGRVILAHLGAGASLAAVRDGRAIDTSMAFTPTGGLVMATRPGDLDPGLLVYLMRTEGMDAAALDDLVSRRSGLLGLSGTTGDMAELLRRRDGDPRAAAAVDLFCYQVRKWIGAFAAALGGLDTLVFSGGIGEHASEVRAAVVAGLEFLGPALDPARNSVNAAVISTPDSRVTVRVIPTDEERVMARAVRTVLGRT